MDKFAKFYKGSISKTNIMDKGSLRDHDELHTYYSFGPMCVRGTEGLKLSFDTNSNLYLQHFCNIKNKKFHKNSALQRKNYIGEIGLCAPSHVCLNFDELKALYRIYMTITGTR